MEAIHLISQRRHSYFDLTLINVILIIIFLSIAILIGLISLKLITRIKKQKISSHRHNTNTLYRLQGPTETQLPLLANETGEQSLTSSLILPGNNCLIKDENNDEQQEQVKMNRWCI